MDWFRRYSMCREAGNKVISLSEALGRQMFGPLYHGTDEAGRSSIDESGFTIVDPEDPKRKHGYEAAGSYLSRTGTPPPIHHLGIGAYLTTKKPIAKDFAGGTTKGMKTYYVDAPDMVTINFGSENTMMKWWKQNGYDFDRLAASGMDVQKARIEATRHLTAELSKHGAVWYKGKGMYKLLDGDQVCIYDPSLIYEIDRKASSGKLEPGAKVKRKSDGMTGEILSVNNNVDRIRSVLDSREPGKLHPWLKPDAKSILTVKWKKGGTDYNVQDVDVDPIYALRS
jgi:hypothetical protein